MTQKDITFLLAKLTSWTKPLKPKKTPNKPNQNQKPLHTPKKPQTQHKKEQNQKTSPLFELKVLSLQYLYKNARTRMILDYIDLSKWA